MNRIVMCALAAVALSSAATRAPAQQIYLNFGNPGYGPPPPGYYGPGYGPPPGAYYRGYGDGYREGYRPGRYRTWNGCQPGFTVQDGRCKPYRGY
jgi:hypothetical protein